MYTLSKFRKNYRKITEKSCIPWTLYQEFNKLNDCRTRPPEESSEELKVVEISKISNWRGVGVVKYRGHFMYPMNIISNHLLTLNSDR